MHLSPIIDPASGENHRDLGHCGQRGNVNRGSGITFELRRLLVENIEAATARWGAVRLMDILRTDLRGNMINFMPESENFSRTQGSQSSCCPVPVYSCAEVSVITSKSQHTIAMHWSHDFKLCFHWLCT